MSGSSLIPDSIKETFADLAATYAQIEGIKLQRRLTDAQVSLASASLPTNMQDAQARSQSVYYPTSEPLSNTTKIMLGAAALLALYLIVK